MNLAMPSWFDRTIEPLRDRRVSWALSRYEATRTNLERWIALALTVLERSLERCLERRFQGRIWSERLAQGAMHDPL